MITLIAIHFIIIFLFICTVLLQKTSKGMIGGSGNSQDMKNFLSKESSRSVLSKITMFLAIGFFITSLLISIMSISGQKSKISVSEEEKIDIPVSE